jgi:hypothetical protein
MCKRVENGNKTEKAQQIALFHLLTQRKLYLKITQKSNIIGLSGKLAHPEIKLKRVRSRLDLQD